MEGKSSGKLLLFFVLHFLFITVPISSWLFVSSAFGLRALFTLQKSHNLFVVMSAKGMDMNLL